MTTGALKGMQHESVIL